MRQDDRSEDRQLTDPDQISEVKLYLLLASVTAVAQFVVHGDQSFAHNLAWALIDAFTIAVMVFGWARSTPGQPRRARR